MSLYTRTWPGLWEQQGSVVWQSSVPSSQHWFRTRIKNFWTSSFMGYHRYQELGDTKGWGNRPWGYCQLQRGLRSREDDGDTGARGEGERGEKVLESLRGKGCGENGHGAAIVQSEEKDVCFICEQVRNWCRPLCECNLDFVIFGPKNFLHPFFGDHPAETNIYLAFQLQGYVSCL